MLVRIANREDPDHTASSEAADLALNCLSRLCRQLVFKILVDKWLN